METIIQRIVDYIKLHLNYRIVDFVDFTRLSSSDIGKFFWIYSESNFISQGIGQYQKRDTFIFVFIVNKDNSLSEIQDIYKTFLTLSNQKNWFGNTTGLTIDIQKALTGNKQYVKLGVEVLYLEVVIYTLLQG